jgi:hypothetical protein
MALCLNMRSTFQNQTMKKAIPFVLFLSGFMLSGWTLISNHNSDSLISWNEYRRLTWDDFKGQVSQSSGADAATAIHISAKPFYRKKKLYYNVNAYFIPEQSWCRSKSERLLAHEQLHFDIAELYARKVRKKISEYRQMGVRDVKEYNFEVSRILEESNRVDQEYDMNTLHGSHTQLQETWQKQINLELQILDRFSSANWK